MQGREGRSARLLRVGAAALAWLIGLVAKAIVGFMVLQWFGRRVGPLGVYAGMTKLVFNECFNVDAWQSPACGGRIGVPAGRSDGFKSNGGRARSC